MIRALLRRFRRRRMIREDAAAYQRACELAVLGEAIAIIEAEQRRWLALDTEERP
jgi:hypothetical protein